MFVLIVDAQVVVIVTVALTFSEPPPYKAELGGAPPLPVAPPNASHQPPDSQVSDTPIYDYARLPVQRTRAHVSPRALDI